MYNAVYMGGKQYRARSGLRDERWFEPAFGVVHRVRQSDDIEFFFDDIQAKLDNREPLAMYDDNGLKVSERPQAYLFNPARLSLRIVERRLTNGYGKRNRFSWHPADRARIEQDIHDQVGKYDLGGRVITAAMGEVHRFGDPDVATKGGRVLAITPRAESLEAEFFATEHELSINGLPDQYKRFRTTAPYLPHVSIGRIHREASPKQVGEIVEMVKLALPLEVELNPIEFTPRRR